MVRSSVLLVALLAFASHAAAQTGANGMFDELYHDFGSVPRGQEVMHPFRVVNNTKQPVQIREVRVSCGRCSSAYAVQSVLQPGQETAIVAKMYTSQFLGTKPITISVFFNQPRTEVHLKMQANSREDVTYAPDNLAFGQVKRGSEPVTKIEIAFPGSPQTRITEIRSESNYISATLNEKKNANGETVYEINATLRKDTPAGKWYTDVWLKTNNASMTDLRIPVTVEVEAPLAVTPSTISLGQVKAGKETDRNVMIRGVKAFRITGIKGTDRELQVSTPDSESRMVHVLRVTINPNEPGDLSRRITVQTDLTTGGDIEFQAQAQVVP